MSYSVEQLTATLQKVVDSVFELNALQQSLRVFNHELPKMIDLLLVEQPFVHIKSVGLLDREDLADFIKELWTPNKSTFLDLQRLVVIQMLLNNNAVIDQVSFDNNHTVINYHVPSQEGMPGLPKRVD